MLDISNPARDGLRLLDTGGTTRSEPEKRGLTLAQLVDFVRRQWPAVTVALLVFVGLGIAYLILTPPRYTAKSLLMLDARRAQVFQQQSVIGEMNFDDVAVASQVEVLKSVNVALAVVRELKLAEDAEFTGDVRSFVRSLLGSVAALVSPTTPDPLSSNDELQRRAVMKLRADLAVQRVGRTYVLEVSYTSLDRHKAARIANAIAEAYILDQLDAKFKATRRASTWLQERINELREEATNSDRAVQNFRVQNQLVETSGRTITDQQLSEINSQLVAARAVTAEAKARARLERISEVNGDGAVSATVADALRNDVINRLRQQWVEASKREAEFSAKYGRDHLAVVSLRKEMAQIQRLTGEELRRIAETYRSEYEIARNREQSLEDALAGVMGRVATNKQAQVALRVLESSAQSYRTLYDSFLTRFVEATQQQSFPNTEARIITPASAGEKSEPRTASVLVFSLLAGMTFGMGVALAREQLDRAFRLPVQVENTLGLECLGILPAVDGVAVTHKVAGILERMPAVTGPRPILRNLGIGRYVVAEPFSRFAETLRGVKVSADTSAPAGHIKVIATVSAVPAEGKSTVALNMAELIAQTGSRALLIDGDLRNPTLTRLIAPEAERGLIEILNGSAAAEDVTWTDPLTGMRFIPAVLPTAIAHTSGLISSPAMERLLAAARDDYDYIVVDLPPMVPVVDARAAAHLMDGFLLVIEWGKTSPEVVTEAVQSAEVVRERIIGAILNKANTHVLKRLEAYKGANYHRYYASYQRG
jgi:succinoglycan biosynthesis transport protein ExoP